MAKPERPVQSRPGRSFGQLTRFYRSRTRDKVFGTHRLPAEMAGLPMAQTIWYIPTGLDIWNQKINKAPGHYARGMGAQTNPPPQPVVHWPDQEPERLAGPLRDRHDHWLTLVHRGRVLDAYRVFLGLMENKSE